MNNEEANKFNRTFITMAEDGMLICWDIKRTLDYGDEFKKLNKSPEDYKLKNVTKWEPVCVIPFCRKNQTGGEPLGGNQIILDTK